jgi:hypothetical protein
MRKLDPTTYTKSRRWKNRAQSDWVTGENPQGEKPVLNHLGLERGRQGAHHTPCRMSYGSVSTITID